MVQVKDKIIGIDIGDTNFRISYLDGKTPRLVQDNAGVTCFPSKVSFLQGGGCLVGIDAEMFGIPENTVLHPMTIIGAPFSVLKQLNTQNVYQFIQEDGQVVIDAHRAFPAVPDVLTAIFAHAKKLAEEHLGFPVSGAVIAIPDGADDPKRIAIKRCAEAAGLDVKQLLNQTTAAALGYRFDLGDRKRIAVIDVGASHTSLSILNGGGNQIEMVSTAHCPVGTNNFRWRLVELINDLGIHEYGTNMLSSDQDFIRQTMLKEAADSLVILSGKEVAEVSIGCALLTGGRVVLDVSRKLFQDRIVEELRAIEATIMSGRRTVDIVLLIGGGANVPAIRNIVDKAFKKPTFISSSVNSLEAVAIGAAVKGGIIDGIISSASVERTVHDLGTFFMGNQMDVLIPKGTIFPCQSTKQYRMTEHYYKEKVYQWIGPGSGQHKREGENGLIVLANKMVRLSGDDELCTLSIDVHGVAQFVVTDLKSSNQTILTGFAIS